ncbi:uncharacterized protein LOC125038764 isoform X2 [Penaeus chinensis]|nr:uncharacterized protein LOC125038764 isoform X2 [Penaeus chinensis]XP_047488306.1 uncharacterized protein LOC125038764 isoform X2 [Penaeus chinensis]
MKPIVQLAVVLVAVGVGVASAAPFPFPVVDSPQTRLFQSLSPTERTAVLHMALTGQVVGNALIAGQSSKGLMSPKHLDEPEVMILALELRHWIKSNWQLTPDQIQEIEETGRLCNDEGVCIDFGGDWGHNCCPFG